MVGEIRRMASERGMSIRELEKQAGVSTGTIYRWDDNKPSADKLLRVAKALGTTVEKLMEDESNDEHNRPDRPEHSR